MPDVFRKEYRPLDDLTKVKIKLLKEIAENLHEAFINCESVEGCDKRMMALAKTNLEQAVMWAVKAIT